MAPARGVEWRFAHQAVHAGFGAQQAKGIFAFDLDGGTFDASGVAIGQVFHRDLEALALAIAGVLTQQHAGPVAGLGAAGAGLDVEEAVQRVGRVVEHPAEFQLFHVGGQGVGFTLDGGNAGLIVFLARHFEQFAVVGQFGAQAVEHQHHVFQRLAFLAQFLGAFGVVPDGRVFQRAGDLAQLQGFGIVVKDTSGARPRVR